MNVLKTINIIGCGKLGKTLARLWTDCGVLKVQSVLNRSRSSGTEAVDFIGDGQAIESYAQLKRADLVMISAPDDAIAGCCDQLCHTDVLGEGVTVFHCSGALSSTLLTPARDQGASIAGMHPVKSFADPAASVESFAGTFCAVEGDVQACEILRDVMEQCGAVTFHVEPEMKTIYHAATVIVCNYLVALMEVGLRCFQQAGLSRETAMEIMRPIVRETAENVFRLGPDRALTGPIARGEESLVRQQCNAIGQWDEDVQRVYKALGHFAVELSTAQGNADPEALAAIKKLLTS